jgi:adenylosuccinate synthase
LQIAKRAHLILPTHRILDAAQESAKGVAKIGSTLKGIGPAYTDKVSRNGLRIGDILLPSFLDKYAALKEKHLTQLQAYRFDFDVAEEEKKWMDAIAQIKSYTFIDSEYELNQYLAEGKKLLAEGAQGSLLDIDFGSYPFVTSSNTLCAGVCTGLGIAPSKIGKVQGIFKAYCTRVGSGPFPTELEDETGEQLRRQGYEFGATTGRARRCGWLDLVALRYAIMLNGVTQLLMMKADVMDNFEEINVAVAYKINGEITDRYPYDDKNTPIEPVYKTFKGWNAAIAHCRTAASLPQALRDYIAFIEEFTGVPIKIVSVGPDREETIER